MFTVYCDEHVQKLGRDLGVSFESKGHDLAGCDTKQGGLLFGDAPQQIYLAQLTTLRDLAFLWFF